MINQKTEGFLFFGFFFNPETLVLSILPAFPQIAQE